MDMDFIVKLIGIIAVILLIVVLTREFFCWYWKTSEIASEIVKLSSKIDVLIEIEKSKIGYVGEKSAQQQKEVAATDDSLSDHGVE